MMDGMFYELIQSSCWMDCHGMLVMKLLCGWIMQVDMESQRREFYYRFSVLF